MSIQDVRDLVIKTTRPYRKGEEVTEGHRDGVHVVSVDTAPPVPQRGVFVDVHFRQIGFTEAVAGVTAKSLLELLRANPEGEFTSLPFEVWQVGPSYITVGAWIGDQGLALALLALGEHVGLWTVMTPAKPFGFEGELADRLAGEGMVLASGIQEPR